jgi:DNA-directed RNA polymerase specialized sigma subunit
MKRQNRKKRRNRKYKPGGNIKAKPIYDPFPKAGLVKQYEPYIRKVVGEFAKHYRRVSHQDFLFRAVELAHAAEKTFKPELGFDFSTYLGGFARNGRLKELHRLHDSLEKEDGVEIYRTEEDVAHEKAEEDGEPTDPVNFAGGGNGVRLLFDLQWWEALLSDIACHFEGAIGPMFQKTTIHGVDEGTREPISPAATPGKDGRRHQPKWPAPTPKAFDKVKDKFNQVVPLVWPTAKRVHRLKLGLQLGQSDNARAAHGRISRDLPHVVKQHPPSSSLIGWIKAVIDHLVRRQREADDEAQKRLAGDHSPTFLEAARNWIDVKFYKGRRSPRFLPKFMPMARLDDAYSHHDDDGEWKRSLHDTIAAGRDAMELEQQKQAALEEAAAIRPKLKNRSDIDMLDSLVARLRGDAEGGLSEIAKEIGITKGAASKVVVRLKKAVGRK